MKCTEARKFLSAFVDNELDVRSNLELLDHVQICQDCSRRVDDLKRLKDAVESYMSSVGAPREVKDRVLESLHRGTRVAGRLDHRLGRLAHTGWFRVSVAAASILLVFGLVYGLLVTPPAALNRQAAMAHIAAVQLKGTTIVYTEDLLRAKRLAFFRMNPKPDVPLLDSNEFELVGAGPAQIELSNVGHFLFRYHAMTISMFVFEDLSLDDVAGRAVDTRLGPARLDQRGDLCLVAWKRSGFTYILVAHLTADELIGMVGPV